MKKLSIIAALLMLASCGHNPVASTESNYDRMPSSTKEIKSCGLLSTTETVRNAVDAEDRLYSLQISCANKAEVAVGFPMNQIHPSQKGWITRWRKTAVKAQKNPSAKPYVCATYQAAYDPCAANKSVYGYAPEFSGKIAAKKVR